MKKSEQLSEQIRPSVRRGDVKEATKQPTNTITGSPVVGLGGFKP